MKKLILTIFAVMIWASVGWGATYYVTESGTGDGSLPTTPKSIANFNAAAAPFDNLEGDTVYFIGIFTTGLDTAVAGASDNRCVLRGDLSGYDQAHWTYDDGSSTVKIDQDYIDFIGHKVTSSESTYGIYVTTAASNVTIQDCDVTVVKTGILINNTTAVSVINNIVIGGAPGIQLQGSTELLCYNNSVSSATGHSIYIGGSSACEVYNNIITYTPAATTRIGVYAVSSDSNDIYSNTITGAFIGVNLYNSDLNDVYLNTISNCYKPDVYYPNSLGQGVFVNGSSEENKIFRNSLDHNNVGISLETSSGNDNNIISFNIVKNTWVNALTQTNGGATNPNYFCNNYVYHNPKAQNNPTYAGHGLKLAGPALKAVWANNLIYVAVAAQSCHAFHLINTDEYETMDLKTDHNACGGVTGYRVGSFEGTSVVTTIAEWQTIMQTSPNASNLSGVSEAADTTLVDITAAIDVSSGIPTNQVVYTSGVTIAGIHDQSTAATDILGRDILILPPAIGAFDGRTSLTVTDDDYAPTGYAVRSGATIIYKGGGHLDMSGLTDTGAITVKLKSEDLNQFTPNGASTVMESTGGSKSLTIGGGVIFD